MVDKLARRVVSAILANYDMSTLISHGSDSPDWNESCERAVDIVHGNHADFPPTLSVRVRERDTLREYLKNVH